MTVAALAVVDRRSTDLITLPRAGVEEQWMDVQAETFEVRRELGRALQDKIANRDPWPHIGAADRRLIRLQDRARQQAAEAAGITFIAPGQTELPLADSCFDGKSTA
jgi:hypothetical protein